MASPLQLVDETGQFNEHGLEDFVQTNQLSVCGQSYVVVAIMGAQSGGKSTLLNHLFRTNFVEMDELKGRRQTTQGVWLAKAEELTPYTLVMDLEGTDGRERGEDGTLFEKQSLLFALAMSDILLINIWHHDIGRVHAAGLPLLKTVFTVMMRLLPPRKMTLMFVVRDVSPHEVLERLEVDLLNDLEKLWNTVKMPTDHVGARLREFFDVEVTLLANYQYRRDDFEKQVANLRNRFSEEGGLCSDHSGTVAGTAFSYSSKLLWEKIKANKDLDLPTHKVMVDTFQSDVIAREKLQSLKSNPEWLTLVQQAEKDVIAGFGSRAGAVVKDCFDGYSKEAEYYDVDIVRRRLQSLSFEVWSAVRPSYVHQIEHHKDQALSQFKNRFDHCNITLSMRVEDTLPTLRQEALDSFDHGCEDAKVADFECDQITEEVFRRFMEASRLLSEDINTYVQGKREAKLSEVTSSTQTNLRDVLRRHTGALLAEAGKSTANSWPEIRGLLREQVARAQSEFEEAFNFDSNEDEMGMIRESLEHYGRAVVEEMVEGEARLRIEDLIMNRFKYTLTHDEQNVPRQWASKKYDIPALTRDAKISSLRLLSTHAAIRLEEQNDGVDEDGWLSDLVPDPETRFRFVTGFITRYLSGEKSPEDKRKEALLELSRRTSWHNVSERDTLITPLNFKSLWESFETQARSLIVTAIKEHNAGVNAIRTFMKGMAVGGVVVAVPSAVVLA